MSYSVKLEKLAREKQKSRDIVKEVLKFGVTEDQKFDIIHGILLSLENNEAIKEINLVLKKYRETINKDEDKDNNLKGNNPKRIILD
jgi:RAB protein geranylgeranyltransferase component A